MPDKRPRIDLTDDKECTYYGEMSAKAVFELVGEINDKIDRLSKEVKRLKKQVNKNDERVGDVEIIAKEARDKAENNESRLDFSEF